MGERVCCTPPSSYSTKPTKGSLLPWSFCAKTNCFRANGNRAPLIKRVISPKTFGEYVLRVVLIKKHIRSLSLPQSPSFSHVVVTQYYTYWLQQYPQNGLHTCTRDAHTSCDTADLGLWFSLYGSAISLTTHAECMCIWKSRFR